MLFPFRLDFILRTPSLQSPFFTTTDDLKERPLLGTFNHGDDELVIREWNDSLVVLPKSTKGNITIRKVVTSKHVGFWVVNPPAVIKN